MNRLPAILLVLLGTSKVLSQSSSLSEIPMKTLENESVTLSAYLEKGPVYITFWALWCEPCKAELRYLQKIQEKYGADGLTILAINHDTQKSLAKVRGTASIFSPHRTRRNDRKKADGLLSWRRAGHRKGNQGCPREGSKIREG